MTINEIDRALRDLRLSGIAATLNTRMMQAQSSQQPFLETLAAMLQDEAPAEAEASGQTRLLISGVDGAPGDGGMSLPKAITAILKQQDVAIVTDPEAKADLVLRATVVVAKPKAGKQNVKIVWSVRRKDGGEIGTVGQENEIPAGLLDGPWGDVAYMVAVSAQDGIMELVARGALSATGKS